MATEEVSRSFGAGKQVSLRAEDDVFYRYDDVLQTATQQQKTLGAEPPLLNTSKFRHLHSSNVFACRSGSHLEVMGMLQGKTIGDTFVVLDVFALPVEGTETRVNAQAEAYEFMVDFRAV